MNGSQTNQSGHTTHSIIAATTKESITGLAYLKRTDEELDEISIRRLHLSIIVGISILFALFLFFCFKFKINGRSVFMHFIRDPCSCCRERPDGSVSASNSPEKLDEDDDMRANESKKRLPSKVVEDQIRRFLERSRQAEIEAVKVDPTAPEDQHSEVNLGQKLRTSLKESRRRSIEEDEPIDRPVDKEIYRARRQADRLRQVDSRGRPANEEEADERAIAEDRAKRIDKATIRYLVKNKSFIKQFKRTSQEQNEILNDPKVQNALKRIRIFAEKEKSAASEKRKRTSRKAASRRADSDEQPSDEKPRRKRSSRSFRISEEAKASKSVIDSTKKFEELNRGLKKILELRKKDRELQKDRSTS